MIRTIGTMKTMSRFFEIILSLLSRLWRRHERAHPAGKVYYCVIHAKRLDGRWIGLAKLEPFTSDTPDPITEPGELWFEFGDTQAEAYWNITDEMVSLGHEKDVIFCDGK